MMSIKSKHNVYDALKSKDYVRAVSCVDLGGDQMDMFVIRAVLAVLESNATLLLEAYLMERVSIMLQESYNSTADCNWQRMQCFIEVLTYCNVFLNIDVSCDRLLYRAHAIHIGESVELNTISRPAAVTFAASVKGGSSSSLTSASGDVALDDCGRTFWHFLILNFNEFEYTKPFLLSLIEHILVNLRDYITDFPQYQQFTMQLTNISRILRSNQALDQCDCPRHCIPIFLAACVLEWKKRTTAESNSEQSSSGSSPSAQMDISSAEPVKEFWSTFSKHPSDLYSILIDRVQFIADSVLSKCSDQFRAPCLCQCHIGEWRNRMTIAHHKHNFEMSSKVKEQPQAMDIRPVLNIIISKFASALNNHQVGASSSYFLRADDIFDAYMDNLGQPKADIAVPTHVKTVDVATGPSSGSSSYQKSNSNGGELDRSTSVWSLNSFRLPLEPAAEEILFAAGRTYANEETESEGSVTEVDMIDRTALMERKARFSQEVLLLQQRFLALRTNDKPDQRRLVTDSDIEESMPRDINSPANTIDMVEKDLEVIWNDNKELAEIRTADRASSPHADPILRQVLSMEAAVQTSHTIDNAATETEVITLQDAETSFETVISEKETQTDSRVQSVQWNVLSQKQASMGAHSSHIPYVGWMWVILPNPRHTSQQAPHLGAQIIHCMHRHIMKDPSQTRPSRGVAFNFVTIQEPLLHVQKMTAKDVQGLFRSAQAFSNIC